MKPNLEHSSAILCPECGELRINTASGSVCPNGHGRLRPRVSHQASKRYQAFKRSEKLPKAVPVDGKPRTFRVQKKIYVLASKSTVKAEAGYLGNVLRLKLAANQCDK